MTVDNRTPNLDLPLPYIDNQLDFDVGRLVSALMLLDTAVAARATSSEMNTAITAAINALVNGAPAALDTLKELADAIADDANFAASVTAALAGWLLAYGQAVSRTTYASLFAAIGTAFGSGDGTTTFNLPDLRGRSAAGKDDMGGTAANRPRLAAAVLMARRWEPLVELRRIR